MISTFPMLNIPDYARKPEVAVALITMLVAVVGMGTLLGMHRVPMLSTDAATGEVYEVALPDFASINDVDEKKTQFFDFFEEYIERENQRLLERREQLLVYNEILDSSWRLTFSERRALIKLAEEFGIETAEVSGRELMDKLLLRVDTIPVSLALAQAANESAWGTSRFAQEGNNYFGQWCYSQGCGIVPERRRSDATHEVQKFISIEQAVQAYFYNINSHERYSHFRQMRAQMRQRGRIDPVALASGLGAYSERGDNYIDELQTIIRQNQLQSRDAG
ncbi:MAG: glucosaminidase domain-containing protein [Pseudohongiellaceae bacterium]